EGNESLTSRSKTGSTPDTSKSKGCGKKIGWTYKDNKKDKPICCGDMIYRSPELCIKCSKKSKDAPKVFIEDAQPLTTEGIKKIIENDAKSKESKIADELNKDYDEICENCGKPKKRHYEAPVLEGEKPIFECSIVRDSGINYRFKPKKCVKTKQNEGGKG
ncbi:hypothetical protein LCGC14_1653800, partial [marine sediment metagenome]